MSKIRGFEPVMNHKTHAENVEIKLPIRSTKTACGYDFYMPIDVDIPPQATVKVMTDIKAYMQDGEGLFFFPRSSTGIKHDLMLSNSVGIGESDFYNNEGNEGNYCIALRNLRPAFELNGYNEYDIPGVGNVQVPIIKDLREQNTVHIKAGDRLVQGIFIQTLPADNCNSDAVRTGGIGSTGA